MAAPVKLTARRLHNRSVALTPSPTQREWPAGGAAPFADSSRRPSPSSYLDQLEGEIRDLDETVLPPVSCVCPTYARPELLEEAIESFLRQDYRGAKELIVLNDYACQTLELDHPEVRVVNVPKRF